MNADNQRIAIAEACGFRVRPAYQVLKPNGKWFRPCEYPEDWKGPDTRPWMPDFLNDLNAMHDAEDALTVEQFEGVYAPTLETIVRTQRAADRTCAYVWSPSTWWTCHATASQRAEAFLKTLNLWEDEK